MANELIGHVALVTGGGRGFGRAIANAFAAEGAAVTITARTTRQIDMTVSEIKSAGGKAFAVPGDVTSRKDVERVIVAAHRAAELIQLESIYVIECSPVPRE